MCKLQWKQFGCIWVKGNGMLEKKKRFDILKSALQMTQNLNKMILKHNSF